MSILQKEKNRGSDGYGFTARAAVSPILGNDMVLHIGAYGTYRTPEASGQENRFVEFRTFPESRVDRRRFVRTEVPNVNHYTTTGIELAYKYQKLLVYGEYIFTDLSRYKLEDEQKVNLKNATFDGWYATASYMLIGKQREYASDDAESSMLVLERDGEFLQSGKGFKKVYKINIKNATDVSGKEVEMLSAQELSKQNLIPANKALLVDIVNTVPDYRHDKPEGISLIDDSILCVVNDDDFGINANNDGTYSPKLDAKGQLDRNTVYFIAVDLK